MNWNTKQVLGLLFAGLMGSGLVSCEDELFIENQALINAEGFNTQKAVYPVHVSQTQIQAAMTNKLSVYQLGNYNDPIFGTTPSVNCNPSKAGFRWRQSYLWNLLSKPGGLR